MRFSSDIVFVASEMYPFSKTGGLGDVMGILPLTMHKMGPKVCVITPLYGRLNTSKYPLRLLVENIPVGYPWPDVTADVYVADYHGMPVYFIDRGEFFDRRHFYCTHKGDFFDNCERFIFFCRAALELMKRFDTPPRIVHAQDWHAALAPAFLHFWRQSDSFWRQTSTVMTIHNLAFQGQFSYRLFESSGLPISAWNMDGVEYYASFNLLKAGIAYADAVSTVSPSYAKEILTPTFGCGLEGILTKRSDRLWGILNGTDYSVWNPENDPFLHCRYSRTNRRGKRGCKQQLLEMFRLSPELLTRPILGFVGRLRRQKGIDLVLEALPELMQRNVGLVVLGEGNKEFEGLLQNLVEQYPGRIGAFVGYTEELSHRILAGSDLFLMPSRYEPCGLTQMYSLRYGALPIAHTVGGLNDTIIPHPQSKSTGFMFREFNRAGLLEAVDQALTVYSQKKVWDAMQTRAMSVDYSWESSVRTYLEMYHTLGYR